MPQQVRVDPLLDLRPLRRSLHDLLDAARRVRQVPVRLKQMAGAAMTQVSAHLLGQFRQYRDVAALAALSLVDQDHQLFKEEMLHPDVNEFRDTRAGLKQSLDEQSVLAPVSVSMLDQALLFFTREALDDSPSGFDPSNAKSLPHFL